VHRADHGRRRAEVRLADVELDDVMALGLEHGGVLAELHRQERRDRVGPIGQSDCALQAPSLGDFARPCN
jgi:hypothetical protein